MNDLITISDLTVGYGQQAIVTGINLAIQRGDFLGVMGPNGTGKTTFLKTLLGLLKPLAGTIVREKVEGGHSLFGYVPQRESLDFYFPLTSLEVALMGRYGRIGAFHRVTEKDEDMARACLKQTHMDPFANRPIANFPVGKNSVCSLPARWPLSQKFFCSMSRPMEWI